MPRMKSRLALLAALLAALMMTGTLVSTSTATARTSVRPFFYPDPRGDAPRGFDIVRVDGNIDGDTLNVAVKIRGLKRWGMLQVGTNSPDLQNLFQIYRDDYGQVRLAGYHRSAWSPFAKWYVGDDCSTAAFSWKPGRNGWITANIPMKTCGLTYGTAEENTTIALVNFRGATPKRRDFVRSIPGGGW
ncbi:MAG TPA: hypothetical protein PKL71_00010 [Marmoricola sp.]|nr:hypothetical protein [Marmoricola sp.]